MTCLARAQAADAEYIEGFRFDLDDVNGEVVLLTYSDTLLSRGEPLPSATTGWGALKPEIGAEVMRYGEGGSHVVYAANYVEGGKEVPFMKRCLRLGGNPFVQPLPPLKMNDPVGEDIRQIPEIIQRIQDDWNGEQPTFKLGSSRCSRDGIQM